MLKIFCVLHLLLQYLGTKSAESVKKKVVEMLYSWQAGLPQEPKIIEAYQMLKKQGDVLR